MQQPLDYEAPTVPSAKAKMGPLAQGAVALLVYPFCLVGTVMAMAAPTPNTGALGMLAIRGFVWGWTIYPLVYLVAAAISLLLSSNERPVAARRVAQVPLVYLLVVLLCFVAAQFLAN